MPKEVFIHTKKTCKKNSSIGLLATEGTLNTGVYNKFFDKNYNLVFPNISLQKNSVNKAIKFVKMGNVKAASKIIKPAINYLIKKKCKKIILGCTEIPIAIFANKTFKKETRAPNGNPERIKKSMQPESKFFTTKEPYLLELLAPGSCREALRKSCYHRKTP